jgi:hypothetical protein
MSLTDFTSRCRRLGRTLGFGLAGAMLATGAHAADPAHGTTVYQTNCTGCHTADPKLNVNKILNGANSPTTIQNAINGNTGGMSFLKTVVSAIDVADVAAYLGTFLPSAVAVVSPTSLTFAGQTVGSTSTAQTFTLSNSGSASLTLSAITASSVEFPLAGGTCSTAASVSAGASCTVSVRFVPSATGTRSASITLTHNATGGTSVVGLSGTGQAPLAPAAAVSPSSLSFTQTVGTTSTPKLVTLSNTGNAALQVNSLSISGTNASDFALASGGSCAAGGSVAAGSNCTVALSFTPAITSTRSASLTINHNATGSPTLVALSGTGTAVPQATIALNKNALAFADQALTTTSMAQTVTVSNTGTAPMTLSALTLAGSNPGDFTLGGTCSAGAAIAVSGNCTLSVSFAPKATGARAASVTIASNASNGSATLSVTGNGITAPAPAVTLAPLAVDFGSVTVGSPAATRAVTLTNSGTAALSLTGISATGTGFAASNACTASLAAGASCNVSVSFMPASAGTFAGQLTVTSNAVGSPHAIALAGTGVLPTLPVLSWSTTATTLAFADTLVGSVAPAKTLTLTNKGPGTVTLATLAVQGAMAAEFPLAGSCSAGLSLMAGASCNVNVAFSPAQMGLRSGSLSVSSNGTNPVAIGLSGNGVAQASSELSASVSALAFRDTAVGGKSAPLPVVLRNTGSSAVTILSVLSSSASFDVRLGKSGLVLRPGEELQLKAWFTPSQAGLLTGTLSITHSASTQALAIGMSGKGVLRLRQIGNTD